MPSTQRCRLKTAIVGVLLGPVRRYGGVYRVKWRGLWHARASGKCVDAPSRRHQEIGSSQDSGQSLVGDKNHEHRGHEAVEHVASQTFAGIESHGEPALIGPHEVARDP